MTQDPSIASPVRKAAESSKSRVTIDIALPCADWQAACPEIEPLSREAALAALATAPALGIAELSIVLGDDELLRRLNREWRGKDTPTNVLSFPAQDFAAGVVAAMPPGLPPGLPLPLGDIVLAFGTVAGEAVAQGKRLADHLAHLVVHGVLHLLGYDHEMPADAERMEGLERTVLAGLGISDPYLVAEDGPRELAEGTRG